MKTIQFKLQSKETISFTIKKMEVYTDAQMNITIKLTDIYENKYMLKNVLEMVVK